MDATTPSGGIGQPVQRKEDRRLVTGQGRFTDDNQVDGALHLAMVRSPHAHARIRGIEVGAAEAVPGVVDVLTAEEIAADGIGSIPNSAAVAGRADMPLENRDGSDRRVTPIPLLAADKVRFVGDGVVAVIAETKAAERVWRAMRSMTPASSRGPASGRRFNLL